MTESIQEMKRQEAIQYHGQTGGQRVTVAVKIGIQEMWRTQEEI